MIKKPFHIISLIVTITLLISCSTRKDRFLNRAAHNTTAKFNVMYNGTLAFDNAKKQLDQSYKDNFYAVLPIEPLKIKEVIGAPSEPKVGGPIENKKKNTKGFGQAMNAVKSLTTEKKVSTAKGFLRAEEKAVKAVQKHSMNFSGNEKNKQMDDAYLLLGKARYYDQRFVPALETFTYITKHFSKSPLLNKAIIWEARCLNRLGNESDAIYNLTNLLRKTTTSQIKSKAYTTLAMAYTSYDSINRVIYSLEESLKHEFENPNQKARNLFILGQLYREENKIDASSTIFNELAAYKKAPYRFKIHALLEKAKNYNKDTDNTEELVSMLKKLSKNRDNRPFLDEIHYISGKIELANNKTDAAILKFNESLEAKIKHPEIQSLVYEELGDYHFDNTAFIKAGEYYDKLLNINVNKPTKRIRSIARKRKSLDEIIRLEKLSSRNDSILNIASMSREAQIAFFTNYINALKKKEKEAEDLADRNESSKSGFGNSLLNSNKKTKGSKFYFYNVQTVGFGQAAFKNIWGDRALVDNWRLSQQKEVSEISDNKAKETKEKNEKKSKKLDVDFYLKQIPNNVVAIDSIASERNEAYYKLGVIYKEKFKKDVLATLKLEKLLGFLPDKKLLLPTYYNLFKAFESFDVTKSNFYKAKILSDYPESKYAKIINDPTFVVEDDKNVMVANYEKTYKKYVAEAYDNTIKDCEKYGILYAGTEITPKFALLKTFALSKKNKNKKAFIKALEQLIKSYPKTEESAKAQTIIDSLNGKIKKEKKSTKKSKKKENKKPAKRNLNKRAMNMGPPSLKSKDSNQVKRNSNKINHTKIN